MHTYATGTLDINMHNYATGTYCCLLGNYTIHDFSLAKLSKFHKVCTTLMT